MDHEDIASISYILRSIISGVDLTRDDLLKVEDHLMDRGNELEEEGLDVPQWFEGIRTIIARLINSPQSGIESSKTAPPLGMQQFGPPQVQQTPLPKKERKQRAKPVNEEPKPSKKDKYKDGELTPDNIPVYLREIHEIINQVVEARCQEEIERREVAEKKLAQLQKILGGL
ncbi:MAG: hypothetical protein WC358_00585 [Ignavibacteria bacterium]